MQMDQDFCAVLRHYERKRHHSGRVGVNLQRLARELKCSCGEYHES
jgi:hypothetical protein